MSDYEYEDEYEYEDDYEYDEDDGEEIAYDDTDGGGPPDDADDPNIIKENSYYEAKGYVEERKITEASEEFEKVIDLDKDPKPSEWTFKSMKQLTKLYLRASSTNNSSSISSPNEESSDEVSQQQKQNAERVVYHYSRLLKCIADGAVTPNRAEKGINGLLDKVSSQTHNHHMARSQTDHHRHLARDVYVATIDTFNPRTGKFPNERLWFKTNLKLGQLYYELNNISKLQAVIKDLMTLHHPHSNNTSNMDVGTSRSEAKTSETNLMEIYALQIQLYSKLKDNKKLREVFNRAMSIQGGIPHPRTLALIQELGGKMHMANREFEAAEKAFFQAFKSYDEAGDPSRLRCLKILVMASMLYASTINPFDSQEARPYRDDPEIKVMTTLVQAFQSNQIREFELTLRRNEKKIMDDEFIREYVQDLLRTMRIQCMSSLVAPYKRISFKYISRELNDVPVEEVEALLVSLILDGKLDGRVDQVNGILERNVSGPGAAAVSSSSTSKEGVGVSGNGIVTSWNESLEGQSCAALTSLTKNLESLSIAVSSLGVRSL